MRACLACLVLILITAMLPLPPLGAQQPASDVPAWVMYQNGIQLLEQGRYGEALRQFRAAAAARAPFPEAEVAIGRVFEAEGSLELALRHYNGALEAAHAFEVPGTAYQVRYRIAEVHRLRGDYAQFEQILADIAREEPAFGDQTLADRRAAYLDVLRGQGFDRLLVLYRVPEGFSHFAHRELGVHFVENERGSPLQHLTFAAMKGFTTLVEELRRFEFDYAYRSAAEVLADALEHRHLRDYIERVELYRTLYYLALALDAESPQSDAAQRIWRVLAVLPDAGEWHLRSLQRVPGPTFRRR